MSGTVPLRTIAKGVAEYFGINESDIFERSRKGYIKDRRFIFFALARELNRNQIPYDRIGKFCERTYGIKAFDHATALHGSKKAKDFCDTEPLFKEEYDAIKILVQDIHVSNQSKVKLSDTKRRAIKKIVETESEEEIEIFLQKVK